MISRARVAVQAAAVAGVSALVLGFATTPASADPIDDARERVDSLGMEAAAIDQDYAAAKEKLDAARERLGTKRDDLGEQREKVAEMREQIGQIALAQFRGRHLDPTTRLLMAPDSDGFISQYATIEKVNATQNEALQDFQTEQANLTDLERATEAEVIDIRTSETAMAEARTRSEQKLAEAENLLERLTEEERQRIAEQERAEAEAAARAAEEAAQQEAAQQDAAEQDADRDSTTATAAEEESDGSGDDGAQGDDSGSADSGSGDSGSDGSAEVSSGSGRAADAVSFAKAQIGKPYGYGATGPGAYDCSGLTGAAWRNAGVSLPRTSQAQYGVGQSVSVSDLQPGDLVFYYGGISHVGIYVGGGQIVHASRPGKPVGYASVNSMPVAGAKRVG